MRDAPNTDPPRYYAMPEDTTGIPPIIEGDDWVILTPQHTMMIYGRAVAFSEDGDNQLLAEAAERGWIWGEWFSELCPDGELGSNHESRCFPIDAETFELARSKGWPSMRETIQLVGAIIESEQG